MGQDSLDFITVGGLFCFLTLDTQRTVIAVMSSSQEADVAVVLASEADQCYIMQSFNVKNVWCLYFGAQGTIHVSRDIAVDIRDNFLIQTIGMKDGIRNIKHRGKGKPDSPPDNPTY